MTSLSEVITDRGPNTAYLAMRLASLAISRPIPIAPWPSPHLSLGKKCSPFGRKECWEVTGPAQVISSDLFGAVRTLLNSRTEYLNEKESKPCFIMFGLYMIGDDGAHANPTLLLSCERKVPRRKALKLVKESGILSGYPGVRLAESIRPPSVIQAPVFLGGAEENLYVGEEDPDIVEWPPSKSICGIPVYGREQIGPDSYSSYEATVGGVVCLNGKPYGLSTAHSFQKEDLSTSAPDDEFDFEFAYGDWEETDSFDKTSETSPTSDTSFSSHSPNSSTQISQSQGRTNPLGTYVPRGAVKWMSLDSGNIGSDWALVEFRPLNPVSVNTVSFLKNSLTRQLLIKSIVQTGPAERKVLAVTGFNGIVPGVMSKIPTFMMLPGGDSFEEVWTVAFKDGNIGYGDCGSWIIDDETGDLYGHIIAGSPESSVAFIMPASTIRSDIRQRFGSDLTLPQDTDLSKTRDDFQPMNSSPMITPGSHGSYNMGESELTRSKAKQSSNDSLRRDTESQLGNERLSQEERDAEFQEAWRRISGNEVEAGPSEANTEQGSARTLSSSNESQEALSLQSSLQSVTQSAWAPVSVVFRPLLEQSKPQESKTTNQADYTQQALPVLQSRGVFGSTISDITIVLTFAKSIYRKCRDAGGEYAEMSREVRGLHTGLRHLKYEVEAPESVLHKGSTWDDHLAPIIGDCDFTLRQLDSLILKCARVGSDAGGKAMWDKLRFGSNEMDQLGGIRVKLISHRTSLTLFLDTIQLRQSGNLASPLDYNNSKLDLILDKVDIIATRMSASNGAYSRLSYGEGDSDDAGREMWKQLKRELVIEGFTSDVLEQHKDVLKAYIREVTRNKAVDDSDNTDVSSTGDSIFDPPPSSLVRGGRRYSTDGDNDSDDLESGHDAEIRPALGLVVRTPELLSSERPIVPSVQKTKQIHASASLDSGYGSIGSPSATSTIQRSPLMTLAPDEFGNRIPEDAKWTKINRRLVSPEVLEQDHKRYEARPDFVFILGLLTRTEIEDYAARTHVIRAARKARFPDASETGLSIPTKPVDQRWRAAQLSSDKDRDRERYRDRREHSIVVRRNVPTPEKARAGGNARSRGKENLTAAGIGGAAASLLSVLSEAAEGL
ncbi:hypothetical protein BKA64DRAFT_636042 [Cadophora sp. MPI-SDFR-AT-0126]|nr:hypothetical protein BKA64DRAFT_636042 [Leotiomycetes sp. MPI-SDFR-AT-0126]